jgi:hypothetical protein
VVFGTALLETLILSHMELKVFTLSIFAASLGANFVL